MNTTDTRYPYAYAADYVRSLVGYENHSLKLSRSDASQVCSGIALAIGMDDSELARKIADYYLANKDSITKALIEGFTNEFKGINRGFYK